MKVCFYLDNSRIKDIDLTEPMKGNPGIGGTEYMIWTVACYLTNRYKEIDIYILAPVINKLPNHTKNILCKDIYEAVDKAQELKAEVLVLRGGKTYSSSLYEKIEKTNISVIMWSHNFEEYQYLQQVNKCKNVKKNICVSKEQYERLIDHEIFKKSTYIYNALDFTLYNKKRISKKKNIVCYLGAIRPKKGFHKVAQLWKEIEEVVPDAELHIIGSGKLYNQQEELGKYGIASKEYEETFIKYLVDENGKIKENIKFWGELGRDKKIEVMSKAKVGIINPIGKDETFCISAVEFEALGVPVIGPKTYGLLNTVSDRKTGILEINDKGFIKAIKELLTNEEVNIQMGNRGKKFVTEKFSIDMICNEWKALLEEIMNNEIKESKVEITNYRTNLKWLRIANSRLKRIKIFTKLPAILEYPEVIYNMKWYKKLSFIKEKLPSKS